MAVRGRPTVFYKADEALKFRIIDKWVSFI
jgi:hypothetical protein